MLYETFFKSLWNWSCHISHFYLGSMWFLGKGWCIYLGDPFYHFILGTWMWHKFCRVECLNQRTFVGMGMGGADHGFGDWTSAKFDRGYFVAALHPGSNVEWPHGPHVMTWQCPKREKLEWNRDCGLSWGGWEKRDMRGIWGADFVEKRTTFYWSLASGDTQLR